MYCSSGEAVIGTSQPYPQGFGTKTCASGVLLDDNNRKPICRLYFNTISRKCVGIFGEGKVETKHDLESLDDIYKYSKELELAVGNYLI